jgi:hypothetical protein
MTYRISVPIMACMVYEVEADNREEALKQVSELGRSNYNDIDRTEISSSGEVKIYIGTKK